jgi:hypothetical protein
MYTIIFVIFVSGIFFISFLFYYKLENFLAYNNEHLIIFFYICALFPTLLIILSVLMRVTTNNTYFYDWIKTSFLISFIGLFFAFSYGIFIYLVTKKIIKLKRIFGKFITVFLINMLLAIIYLILDFPIKYI